MFQFTGIRKSDFFPVSYHSNSWLPRDAHSHGPPVGMPLLLFKGGCSQSSNTAMHATLFGRCTRTDRTLSSNLTIHYRKFFARFVFMKGTHNCMHLLEGTDMACLAFTMATCPGAVFSNTPLLWPFILKLGRGSGVTAPQSLLGSHPLLDTRYQNTDLSGVKPA